MTVFRSHHVRILLMSCCLSFLVSCASTGVTSISEDDDALEKFNKTSYNVTDWVDEFFLKPVATGYQTVMPDPAERAVSRAFGNIDEIGTAANSLLQGKFSQAANDTARVLTNSTIGVLGLFEVAEGIGLEKNQPEDFGQTLAVWGVPSGSYFYIPFLGPSTVRDTPSRFVDWLLNPISYVDDQTDRYILSGVDLIQTRASLLEDERLISGDRYLFLKDAYLQRREYLINDGRIEDDFEDDFDTDF